MQAAAPWPGSGVRPGGAWRFALVSLLLHAAALGLLWRLGPWPLSVGPRAEALRPTTVDDARRQRTERFEARARQAEDLARDALRRSHRDAAPRDDAAGAGGSRGSEPGDARAGTPLERMRRAAEALEARDRLERAAELARLLRLPLDEASARVAAEAAAKRPEALDEAAALAQWEQRAQEAAQRLKNRAERTSGGQPVAPGARAPAARPADGAPGHAPGGPVGAAGERAGERAGTDGGRDGTGGGGGGSASTGSGPGSRAGGEGSGAGAPPLEGPSGFADRRNYGPDATVAAAAQAPSPVARARRLGAGGPATPRIVLDRWYVAGPFAASGPRDLTRRVFPPELSVDLDAVYEGQGGRLLRWQWSDQPGYPFVPQPRREDAIYFAYTELFVDQAQEVWLDLGVDDDARLWLNDELVWTSGPESKPWYRQPYYTLQRDIANRSLVEASRRVRLQAGRNRVLLKLYNGIDLMFFSVVVRR